MSTAKFTASTTLYIAILALTTLTLAAGCQQESTSQQVTTQPAAINQSVGSGKTLKSGMGYSIANIKEAPADVQDLVDRSHAMVIGTIASVSSPENELPYNKTTEDYPTEDVNTMRLRVTYYDITVEEVLLDDGFVSDNARLRLDGDHSLIRPQIGERFLFSLSRNPGNSSYGVVADWMVLTTTDGVKNYDGTDPGYEGVSDKASFLRVVRTAAQSHNFKDFGNWPNKP